MCSTYRSLRQVVQRHFRFKCSKIKVPTVSVSDNSDQCTFCECVFFFFSINNIHREKKVYMFPRHIKDLKIIILNLYFSKVFSFNKNEIGYEVQENHGHSRPDAETTYIYIHTHENLNCSGKSSFKLFHRHLKK